MERRARIRVRIEDSKVTDYERQGLGWEKFETSCGRKVVKGRIKTRRANGCERLKRK